MTDKPTVGRIVHFYSDGLNINGQGPGPYPAVVLQNFPGDYINLLVHGWERSWCEGSVSEWSETNKARYWVWPPRT